MDTSAAKQQFREADDFFRQGRYQDALTILYELNRRFPNEKHILYPVARCLKKLGHIEDAKRLCQDLVRLYDHPGAKMLLERMETATVLASSEALVEADPGKSTPVRVAETVISIGMHYLRLPVLAVLFGSFFLMLNLSLNLAQNTALLESAFLQWLIPESLQNFRYTGGLLELLGALGRPIVDEYGWLLIFLPIVAGFLEFVSGRHLRDTAPSLLTTFALVGAYFVLLGRYALLAMPFEGDEALAGRTLLATTGAFSFAAAIGCLMALNLVSLLEEILADFSGVLFAPRS